MKAWIARGLALAALGGLGLYAGWPKPDPLPPPPLNLAPQRQRAADGVEVARLRARVERLGAEVLALRQLIAARPLPGALDAGVASASAMSAPPIAAGPGLIAWRNAWQRMGAGKRANGLMPKPGAGSTGASGSPSQFRTPEQIAEAREAFRAHAAEQRDARLARFAQRVGLSEAQRNALQDALAAERARMQALRTEATDPLDLQNKVRALRGETNVRMKATLDESQYTQYLQMRRRRMWGLHPNHKLGSRPMGSDPMRPWRQPKPSEAPQTAD